MFPIRMYLCTGTQKTVYIHRVQLVTVQAGPHSGTVCHQKCCVLYKLLFVAILFVAKWIRTSLKKTDELGSRALQPMVRKCSNLNLPPYRIPQSYSNSICSSLRAHSNFPRLTLAIMIYACLLSAHQLSSCIVCM